MSKFINFLEQADIFFQFRPTQLEMVASICEERADNLSEMIVEESSSSKELYIIIQGEADVLINPALVGGPGAIKSEVTVATLRRGQSFGEIALVGEGCTQPRCAPPKRIPGFLSFHAINSSCCVRLTRNWVSA